MNYHALKIHNKKLQKPLKGSSESELYGVMWAGCRHFWPDWPEI